MADMAEKVTASFMIAAGGWVVALAIGFITAFVQWRKGSVDETAMVLGQWRDLVTAHQSQIEALNSTIARLNAELTDVRKRLLEAENRIRDLEAENAGLKRAIAQNSQSAVYQIGRQVSARIEEDKTDDRD